MKKIILTLSLALCSVALCWSNDVVASGTKTPQYPFYQSYIELSGRMTSPLSGGGALEMINGCRLNQYVYIGGGVGVTSFFYRKDKDYIEAISTPLYADIRAYAPLRSSNIVPYTEIAIGPLFNYHAYRESTKLAYSTMAYFKVALGIDIIDRFTIGAGYELWGNEDGVINFGFFKLGVRIGQDKNVY